MKAWYKTVAGSAGASDFRAKSGVVRFKPESRHAHIRDVVTGDNQHEGDETFSVKLSIRPRPHEAPNGRGHDRRNDPAGGATAAAANKLPDADGDGIPDGLDACPQDPDPDGYARSPFTKSTTARLAPGRERG